MTNPKGKNGVILQVGDPVKYPQYDSVLDEETTNDGKVELSPSGHFIIDTANPDYVDYSRQFWARVELIEK
jgi:hypothetical protein